MKTMWREDLPRSVNPFTFLLFASRPYRGALIAAVIAVILGAAATSLTGYTFKLIVDAAHAASNGGPLGPLWWGAIAFITIAVVDALAWRVSGLTGMHWSTGVRATARYALTSFVTTHSYTYFTGRFAGSISSKITQAANGTKSIGDNILWQFLPFFVYMGVSFALAFMTHPVISFIFLAWVCVITPLNIYVIRWSIPLSVTTQRAETRLGGATVDNLTNINAVHEYARRSHELERLKELIVDRRVTGMQSWSIREYIRLGNALLQILFIGGIILFSTYLTSQGLMTAGDIVLILTIVLLVQERLSAIGGHLNNFGDEWGQVVESLSDLVQEPEIVDAAGAEPLSSVSGTITLSDLTFAYAGSPVFSNLSLTIPEGQKVGLVGRSGAGKSTLVKLLLRHYEPTGGAILIDERDISGVTRDSLRENIAVVPQEPMLFHRSIRDNIAYGKADATQQEIERAAQLAQAHDFIEEVPGGYDALVGERGVKLSGGQRQRIVIARALLKNAPILILDEATSSLDSESEGAVQKALMNIMEGRTVIAIAHRLSTLRAMDRIIVMDAGRIIEDGTHDELIKKGGLYADLWNHQAGGFLTEE